MNEGDGEQLHVSCFTKLSSFSPNPFSLSVSLLQPQISSFSLCLDLFMIVNSNNQMMKKKKGKIV
jgi:hypothetical protein